MQPVCILCKAPTLTVVGNIVSAELARLYQVWLAQDMRDEFRGARSVRLLSCGQCDLKFFDPCLGGSPGFYEVLSRKMGSNYYLTDKCEYRLAASHIQEGNAVLDVGAGAGRFSKHLPGISYTGLDFNPAALSAAEREGIRVLNETLEMHGRNHPRRYDVVTCFQVLEHVTEPRVFLEECLVALKPGGLLIVSVPSDDSYVPLQGNAILNMPPHHVTRWTDQCLTNLGQLLCLSLVSLEHESLSSVHLDSYLRVMARRTLNQLFGIRDDGLLNTSFRARVADRISETLLPIYRKFMTPSKVQTRGHSVTAVFRKGQE